MNPRPKALFVLADLPFPPRSGNHLRDLQNLKVADLLGYDVHVVAGRRSWPGERSVGPVGQLYRSVSVADEKTTILARLRRASRLVAPTWTHRGPGPWALIYEDAGLDEAVSSAVSVLSPPAVILRSTLTNFMSQFRQRVGKVVLDVHDSDVLLARSLMALASPLRRPGAWARLLAANHLERLMGEADELWVPSPREAQHFASRFPTVPCFLVPNGVSIERSQPLPRDPTAAELLLIAGFGYPPNEAAAVRLVERILPRVRERLPNAHATLVGRDLPTYLVRRWANRPVTWLGVVDDVGPLYQRAAALVLAYDSSTASGTPLKVAESLAYGLPVVATPNATEPLGLSNNLQVLVGESDEDLARAVCSLLSNPQLTDRISRDGFAWARANLSAESIAARLSRGSCLAGEVKVSA